MQYNPQDEATLESILRPQYRHSDDGKIIPSSTTNSIFAVNQQIYREARAVFFFTNRFLIANPIEAQLLLGLLPDDALDLRLGPLLFWIPMDNNPQRWVPLLRDLKLDTAAQWTSAGKLKLCFHIPRWATWDDVSKWKRAFFVDPTRWRVSTGAAREQEPWSWPEITTTSLGSLEKTIKPMEGNLSFVRMAACCFETEVGFYDTVAHIPY
ncbi:hypothetical protein PG999_003954 [Apiospora kogelbergensis]|uniref:Uncharacterized protein n=1 Tax=Apiospora kogelbergensis TaxID=1337665 RepID=A0AAW0R554_9PEZI